MKQVRYIFFLFSFFQQLPLLFLNSRAGLKRIQLRPSALICVKSPKAMSPSRCVGVVIHIMLQLDRFSCATFSLLLPHLSFFYNWQGPHLSLSLSFSLSSTHTHTYTHISCPFPNLHAILPVGLGHGRAKAIPRNVGALLSGRQCHCVCFERCCHIRLDLLG